jgi:hypothetical protein
MVKMSHKGEKQIWIYESDDELIAAIGHLLAIKYSQSSSRKDAIHKIIQEWASFKKIRLTKLRKKDGKEYGNTLLHES